MQHGDAMTRLPNTRSTQCGHDTLQCSSTERDSLRHQVGYDAAIVVTRFAIVQTHVPVLSGYGPQGPAAELSVLMPGCLIRVLAIT
jgi:hypothetical protein